MKKEITIIEPNRQALANRPDYEGMITVLLGSMSANSRRQYQHTYTDWKLWCAENGLRPDELSAPNVDRYLRRTDKQLSRATLQARLTHLRALVQALYAADTTNSQLETYYAQLKMLKLPKDLKPNTVTKGKKRKGKRIDPGKVHELINSYPATIDGKPNLKGLRNRALLAVLFYAGLRRFEAAKLKWEDIDFKQEHIQVVGGKGKLADESQYVPFLGAIERHLTAWRDELIKAGGADRVYVFPRFRRGEFIGKEDRPISADGLYGLFYKDFAPHDARRTLISSLLDAGTYIGDVRVIARHASESTTLRYAKAHDTKVIKARAKLDY